MKKVFYSITILLVSIVFFVGCLEDAKLDTNLEQRENENDNSDTDQILPTYEDKDSPTILSIDPSNNSHGIPPDKQITIKFSKKINQTTLTNENIQLKNNDLIIETTLDYNDEMLTLTIKPKQNLAWSQKYSIIILKSIKDISDNEMVSDFQSSFYTTFINYSELDFYLNNVKQTVDGNYILGGGSRYANKIVLLNLSKIGEINWNKDYNFDGLTYFNNMDSYNNENVIIGVNKSSIFILKTNNNGDVLSAKKLLTNKYNETGLSIIHTSDNNYILSGKTNDKAMIIKLNANFEIQWKKFFYYTGYTTSTATIESSDGTYISIGTTLEKNAYNFSDIFIVKFDKNGNIIWNYTYGSEYSDEALSIIQTKDLGYLLVGKTNVSKEPFKQSAIIIKLNQSGVIEWSKSFGINNQNGFDATIENPEGNLLIGGHINNQDNLTKNVLINLDKNGNFIWGKQYAGNSSVNVEDNYYLYNHSIDHTSDAGYIISGHINKESDSKIKSVFLKLNKNGDIPDCNLTNVERIEENATIIQTRVNNQISISDQDREFTIQDFKNEISTTDHEIPPQLICPVR